MRKTKVICTIGPACEDAAILKDMCLAGMNVARLNFSHGTHEEHQQKIDLIKSVREELNYPIALMLDTKGPEYRIGTFENKKITLKDGDTFTFTTRQLVGNESIVSVNYDKLMENLEVGDKILVNNGLVIFEVAELNDTDAKCNVVIGGELSNRKSMNFPGKVMKHDFLSEQDKKDLLFGIKNDVDFVAASFVSTKQDVADMRAFLDANGGKDIEIIAKIENRSGVNNIEEICQIANGVMVARGDLGVEIPAMEVPSVQIHCLPFVCLRFTLRPKTRESRNRPMQAQTSVRPSRQIPWTCFGNGLYHKMRRKTDTCVSCRIGPAACRRASGIGCRSRIAADKKVAAPRRVDLLSQA